MSASYIAFIWDGHLLLVALDNCQQREQDMVRYQVLAVSLNFKEVQNNLIFSPCSHRSP